MKTLEATTKKITDWFAGHAEIQETTGGDISEIDLSGASSFPIVHTIFLSTTYPNGVRTFNYQILVLDQFLEARDSKLEIISRMDEVVSEFVAALYGGSLFTNKIRVNTTPTGEVMYDQLKNRLFGVSLNLSIKVPYTTC